MTSTNGVGNVNVPAVTTDTPVHLGVAVPSIVLSPGAPASIPAPLALQPAKGPVPLSYPYCVIVNSSGFAIDVIQGGHLCTIAAFTQDLVQVPQADGTTPITIVPGIPTAALAPGIDQTLYATWYPDNPGGQYPAAIGAGAVPIGTSQIIAADAGGNAFMTLQPLVMPAWVQCVAVTPTWVAPGTGCQVLAVGSQANVYYAGVVDSGQTVYIPMNADPGFQVILSKVGGGVFEPIALYGLTGPVTNPHISSWGFAGSQQPFALGQPNLGPQPPVNVNVLAGATTNLIPAPRSGYQIRIKSWMVHFSVAPAAGTQIVVRRTTAADILARLDCTAAIVQPGSPWYCDLWVPDNSGGAGVNIPDGVDVQNTTAQACVVTIEWELWATILAPV